MAFSTTIKKVYWEKKMEDLVKKGHFYEYKSTTDYWIKRLRCLDTPCAGVFLVGNKVHRVTVLECVIAKTRYIPKEYEEAITTDKCFVLKCCIEDYGVGG